MTRPSGSPSATTSSTSTSSRSSPTCTSSRPTCARRGVHSPRLSRRDGRPADAGRGARVPGRQVRRRQASELIDRVLDAPGVRRFLGRCSWTTCCRTARKRDHDVRGIKGVRSFHDWMRQQVAANRPWDEMARDAADRHRRDARHPGGRLLHRQRSARAASRTSRSVVANRSPRRSSAPASAVPSATTIRSKSTRRTITTTSPASSRASSSTARTRRWGRRRSDVVDAGSRSRTRTRSA